MHECIPYESVVPFTIQRAVFVTEDFGTHKCVPYENDWALSYILIRQSPLMPLFAVYPWSFPDSRCLQMTAFAPVGIHLPDYEILRNISLHFGYSWHIMRKSLVIQEKW